MNGNHYMNQFRKINLLWLALAFAIILLDQFTKNLVLSHFNLYESLKITSFFNITLSFNTGAAFSFLSNAEGWQQWLFGSIALIVSIILIILLLRAPQNQKLTNLSFSLIVAGALGNFIDRITRGYVVDFLHFHIKHWSWPIFNVADSAVCIGAGLLLLSMFYRSEK